MVWHAHRWNPARDPTSKERKSKKKRRENSVWLLVLRKRLLFVNQWYAFAFVNYYGLDISIIITVWSPLFFTWCPAPPILVCSHSVWSRTGVYCTFPFHSWLKWTAVMLRAGAPSCYHEILEKKTRWCFCFVVCWIALPRLSGTEISAERFGKKKSKMICKRCLPLCCKLVCLCVSDVKSLRAELEKF